MVRSNQVDPRSELNPYAVKRITVERMNGERLIIEAEYLDNYQINEKYEAPALDLRIGIVKPFSPPIHLFEVEFSGVAACVPPNNVPYTIKVQELREKLGRDPTLDELLEIAVKHTMTEEELKEQAQSFARANMSTGDPRFD